MIKVKKLDVNAVMQKPAGRIESGVLNTMCADWVDRSHPAGAPMILEQIAENIDWNPLPK